MGPATVAEFLREQLFSLGRITTRRMFGKTGVFCGGGMFGMVANNTLYSGVDLPSSHTASALSFRLIVCFRANH
jgi:TfoX/Sxy family transcriptional regulator of competence genes